MKYLDHLALFIQIVASIIMFLNAAKNVPIGAWISNDDGDDVRIAKKREYNMKIGFGILCLGFILQLISLLIKNNC